MATKKVWWTNKLTDFQEIERANTTPTEIPKEKEIVDMSIDPKWPKWVEDKTVESELVWEELTPRQMAFIEHYCWDMLGNWVQSYLEVYDINTSKPWWYKTACAASSRLLSNVKVYNKINEMLEESWLNDNFIDKQLLFLASQQSDLTQKLWAIKEYNKLKQRITDKLKDVSDSDQAKAELYKEMKEKVKDMNPDEISTSLQNLLN